MNKILQIVLVVVGILVLAGGLFFAGTFLGSRLNQQAGVSAPGVALGRGGQDPSGQRNGPGTGGGRMNDGGGGRGTGWGAGPFGMMPGNDRGQASLTPVTIDEAKTAAQTYLTALKIDGLEIGDVTLIGESAYVVVKETAGGNGAFELVVDPRSKTAHPAGGASMMWNLKYGGVLHAGMMLDRHGPNHANATPVPAATSAAPAATPADVSADMPVSAEQAVTAAQAFLDKAVPGATAAATPLKFYGYYSLGFSKDGKLAGMLSINGFNGEVLPNMPHGAFMHESK